MGFGCVALIEIGTWPLGAGSETAGDAAVDEDGYQISVIRGGRPATGDQRPGTGSCQVQTISGGHSF